MDNSRSFYRGKPKEQVPCGDPPENATFDDFVAPLAKLLGTDMAPVPPGNFDDRAIRLGDDVVAVIIMDAVHDVMSFQCSGEEKRWWEQGLVRDVGRELNKQINRKMEDRAKGIDNPVRLPRHRTGPWQLLDYFKRDWDGDDLLHIGSWALDSAFTLDMFDSTAAIPTLRPKWREAFKALRLERCRKRPERLPSKSPRVNLMVGSRIILTAGRRRRSFGTTRKWKTALRRPLISRRWCLAERMSR